MGNGGGHFSTGWRPYELTVGQLASGSPTVRLGGYNSKKTNTSEFTDLLIDEVIIAAR